MKFVALSVVLLLSISPSLSAKVLAVNEHGFIVENSVSTNQSATLVWQALVNDIDKWWPKDHSWWGEKGKFTLNAKAGGCFCEVSGNKSAQHMRIVFVEPSKLLRMSGGLGPLQGMGMNGALTWVITEEQGNTMITLTYRVHGINPGGFQELAPIVANV